MFEVGIHVREGGWHWRGPGWVLVSGSWFLGLGFYDIEDWRAIAALIVDIDEGRGRISLSTKVLESYAGEVIENLAEVVASAESRAESARAKLDQVQGSGS